MNHGLTQYAYQMSPEWKRLTVHLTMTVDCFWQGSQPLQARPSWTDHSYIQCTSTDLMCEFMVHADSPDLSCHLYLPIPHVDTAEIICKLKDVL